MTDSFGVEKHRVVHVGDASVMSLACMEEGRQVLSSSGCFLGTQHRGHEAIKSWRVLFLVDHVVAYDQVRISFPANADVVKDFGYVRLADHFVACEDQLEVEIRDTRFDIRQDILNQLKFVKKWNDLVLLSNFRRVSSIV